MSTTEAGSGPTELEQYAPFTPFESSYSFEPEASPVALEDVSRGPAITPFVSEYAGEPAGHRLEERELQQLLFDLYDREFDEQLAELTQEAAAVASDRAGLVGEMAPSASAEQFLEEWLRPVQEHAVGMLEGVAEAVAQTDVATMGEQELEELFERFEPRETGLEAHFENFLGGLLKKAKSVVSGAVALAKKGVAAAVKAIPGLSGLIEKLKGLVKPLLERVLRMALDRLPPGLRGPAQTLAQRVLGGAGLGEAEDPTSEAPAVPEIPSVQHELNLEMASLLFAADEAEQEVVLAESATEREDESAPLAGLVEARAEFLDELERGQDPQQAMERFIPAVMAVLPIARTVIGIIGRPRVVSFLAGFLSKAIERHVGPQVAPQLSQAIVDTGLRLLTLEAPSEAEMAQLAPAAVAGAVEDTVRRVAELDEATLENPALLEAAVQEAFSDAAAENFPPQLLIPEVREAGRARGTWVLMPLGSPRKYYKKYTEVRDIEISLQAAESLRTFGGVTLASFLRSQLGVTPPVRARIHLYQALPGTWPSRISLGEKNVPGLGTAAKRAWSQLHPLTPKAARTLLGEPRLGRRASPRYVAGRDLVAVGQRLYFLEIAGARPLPPPADGKSGTVRRSSEVNVTLDFAKDEFRVFAFLSETDAQEVAARIRRGEIGAGLVLARRTYEAGLRSAMQGDLLRHVKVRTEVATQEQFVGGALRLVGKAVLDALAAKVVEWAGRAVGEYLQARAAEFTAATEDLADGVTIAITLSSVPGAAAVRKLVRGQGLSPAELANPTALFSGVPQISVKTVAGFRFD
jgi:hypothetical protein